MCRPVKIVGYALLLLSTGCGARTELRAGEREARAAGGSAGAGLDAGVDVEVEDAPPDVSPDVRRECETPDTTYIYVVTDQAQLLAFKPQSNSFERRGRLLCPTTGGPFSMAVDRTGLAYVEYRNADGFGELFAVSTLDASCEPTSFVPLQHDFGLFGMGFGPTPQGGEALYVAEITFEVESKGLGWIDTDTFELTPIGRFSQNPGLAIELTPTGEGPLYGYFLNNPGPGGTLVRIDTSNAAILEATPLTIGNDSSSLAIAWWGGFFYVFTGSGAGSDVTRYDPQSGSTQRVATLDQGIVGAGVSSCAPER